ncbi:hypothetical protein RHGRI_027751 [Rhododendron griersonianum]|uniref:DUF676 domain-containing protein n=1 Tax=Rhododendron griersonianum TaxID=479676 RepID=A0AAV6J192_9ERIC|nr:hypothetical protein RHGRI_027751 [Rhododendron griersonianum]
MENDTAGTGACSSETANGGEVVWSCNQSDAASANHLVVMVHGILGSATDWKFAAEQFVRMLPDKVFVHCSERNAALLTLDGVDVMGERLAGEVLHVIKQKPSLRKISFVAHSLGGLVARYAIGILFKPSGRENAKDVLSKSCVEESKGTIGGLEPMNFITVATPHLGSRGNKQVPLFFGVTVLEKAAVRFSHLIFKKTGQHLFLADDIGGKPPLLKRMVEDCDEFYFMSGLRSFKRRVAYSNVGYDRILLMPLIQFSIWLAGEQHQLDAILNFLSSMTKYYIALQWEDSLNEKYPHIVYEEHCKAYDTEVTEHCDSMLTEDDDSDKLEEELVTGLSRVSWEKVDVSFHSSRLRFAAHSVIQVKDHYMHSEGTDVIQHMIDHFLV